MLFKLNENYYQWKDGKFLSFGKSEGTAYSIGSWFRCGEEESKRLRERIFSGQGEVKTRIPGKKKEYSLDV